MSPPILCAPYSPPVLNKRPIRTHPNSSLSLYLSTYLSKPRLLSEPFTAHIASVSLPPSGCGMKFWFSDCGRAFCHSEYPRFLLCTSCSENCSRHHFSELIFEFYFWKKNFFWFLKTIFSLKLNSLVQPSCCSFNAWAVTFKSNPWTFEELLLILYVQSYFDAALISKNAKRIVLKFFDNFRVPKLKNYFAASLTNTLVPHFSLYILKPFGTCLKSMN